MRKSQFGYPNLRILSIVHLGRCGNKNAGGMQNLTLCGPAVVSAVRNEWQPRSEYRGPKLGNDSIHNDNQIHMLRAHKAFQ